MLEEIRNFKNNHKSHTVSNTDGPIAPRSWNRFLKEQIQYVKAHPDEVKDKIYKLPKKSHKKEPGTNNMRKPNDNHVSPTRYYNGYPKPPFGRIEDFIFSKSRLKGKRSDSMDKRMESIFSAVCKFEHIDLSRKMLLRPGEGGFPSYRYFVTGKAPLPKDTPVFYIRFREIKTLRTIHGYFNTYGSKFGSMVLIEWEKGLDPKGHSTTFGRVYGLYYFSLDLSKSYDPDDCVHKMLRGRLVELKTY